MSSGREKWKRRGSTAEGTVGVGRVSVVCDVLGWDFGGLDDFIAAVSSSPGFDGWMVGTMLDA